MPTTCKTNQGTRCQKASHSSPKRTSLSTTHRTAGFSRRAELHSHTSLHLDLCNHTRESLKHYHHWRVLTHSPPYISARKDLFCAPPLLHLQFSPLPAHRLAKRDQERKITNERASLRCVGTSGSGNPFFSQTSHPDFLRQSLSQSATENN